MASITEVNTQRGLYISQVVPVTVIGDWEQVTGASNIITPPRDTEIYSSKTTDSGGNVRKTGTWNDNGSLECTIEFDTTNTTHLFLQAAQKANTIFVCNAHVSNVALVAHEFLGMVTNFSDGGTDQGVLTRTVTITPCDVVDDAATPAPYAP